MLYYKSFEGAWCSGLTCGPVKAEIAGSIPVAPVGVWKKSDLRNRYLMASRELLRNGGGAGIAFGNPGRRRARSHFYNAIDCIVRDWKRFVITENIYFISEFCITDFSEMSVEIKKGLRPLKSRVYCARQGTGNPLSGGRVGRARLTRLIFYCLASRT